VSCPCALSLATPAALAASAGALGRRNILVVRGHALEALARVTHVVFDKTGTLTTGQVRLVHVIPRAGLDRACCIDLAAALEQGSQHPIARALLNVARSSEHAHGIVASAGNGVEGVVAGRRMRLGRPDWAGAIHGQSCSSAMHPTDAAHTGVALADESGWIAWFEFCDALRPEAKSMVDALKRMGKSVSLLSGDRTDTAKAVARAIGIDDAHGDARPDEKRAFIAARQRDGAVVAMIGDGINDAPSLAQANVSLSLGSASALTQWTADVVLLGDDITRIADAFTHSRRTFRIIHQNLVWAVAYNAVAIPLAAMGWLTPVLAAVGMSVSSLLVVANALRVSRMRRDEAKTLTPDAVLASA